MLKIGLTGGIGSGKTTVAHIFEVLGIPVYYADDEAKKIMNEDDAVKTQIIQSFGTESYVDGRLNKSHISNIIFKEPSKTALINAIVHPITVANAKIWMSQQTTAYAIKEAALIFEAKAEKELDFIIGVTAPLQLRIKRVMSRDKIYEAAVQARMQKQMNEEDKMNRCDFVIHNDEDALLIPQVLKIHQQLLEKSQL
jgi:dephospho-CoA kinase